eukprot:2958974-Pyramimonas_sp.AAC.1
MADWNLTPLAVEKSGLPQRLGGKVIRPSVEVTCDKGKGSLIDSAVAREDISAGIRIEAVAAVQWRTRTLGCGSYCQVDRKPGGADIYSSPDRSTWCYR